MKGGKCQCLRKPQASARVSMLTFLRANFQVATREQRRTWFSTDDREEFEIILDRLFTRSRYDYDARCQLDQMVSLVHAHVLDLVRKPSSSAEV
jgi:hypothetical protein